MKLTKVKHAPENESLIITNWVRSSCYRGVIRFSTKERDATELPPSLESGRETMKIEFTQTHPGLPSQSLEMGLRIMSP